MFTSQGPKCCVLWTLARYRGGTVVQFAQINLLLIIASNFYIVIIITSAFGNGKNRQWFRYILAVLNIYNILSSSSIISIQVNFLT